MSGAYSNNPHVLVRYDIEDPNEEFLSLVLSQYKKTNDIAYTLSCFCTESFSFDHPEKELPEIKAFSGQWTLENAGGPVGQDDFFRNPMYLVVVPSESTVQIQCSTVKTYSRELNSDQEYFRTQSQALTNPSLLLLVNVMLVGLNKQRKGDYSSYRELVKMRGRPVIESGIYRYGFTTTYRQTIPAGEYVLVLSTFRKDQVGAYKATVKSSTKLQISIVP